MTTLPNWLWIAALTGSWLFGGICAGVLLFALFGREERDTMPRKPPVHVPELWPPDDEHTRTKISRTC